MPTVAEVLKASGFDDAAIAAFDQRAVTAFQGVLTTAEQKEQAGQQAQRAAEQLFNDEINPALTAWGNREANLTAERDYYKTLAIKAKDGGFIADVPEFKPAGEPGNQGGNQPGTQPRVPGGQPNGGQWAQTPGSPDVRDLENRMGSAIGVIADLGWKYQSLFGTVMPDSPTALAAEAAQRRLPLADYAAQKYDFAGKEKSLAEAKQKEHDDAIRKAAVEDRDKHWAERIGNNPNVRMAEPSRFTELSKGVADGSRPDPLKMTPEQRRAATRNAINTDRNNAAAAA